jgi:micrococcal nuclease
MWALVLAVAIALIAAGCADTASAPGSRVTTAPTSRTLAPGESAPPTATLAPLPSADPAIDIPYPGADQLQMATVIRVIDGDTIDVFLNGTTQRLRYIGIDTPETVDPSRPIGCYGHEASDKNRELVEGKQVGLEKDASETDEFGRLLRYVWVGELSVNAALVKGGYAESKSYPPNTGHQAALDALQRQAQAAQLGRWGPECANATAVPTVTQTPPPGIGNEVCDFSGTNQPVIKGNISRSGEKIYHVPGQDSYDGTGISTANGERWFCMESEAVDAGWRKSQS